MIETLISSKTRIKLLMKFFINSNATAYLRSLESEFGESTNSIRIELNKLENAGFLHSFLEGNKKYFKANIAHPLFRDIHNILLKHIGIDQIIENIIVRLGNVEHVLLDGDFSKGKDSEIVDLVLVGDIDTSYLMELSAKVEKVINRKLRHLILSSIEFQLMHLNNKDQDLLLLWSAE